MAESNEPAPPAKRFGLLKTIVVVLIALVVGLVVVIALQPADFRIERSMTMNATPAEVFPEVNNLRNWPDWSPWAKLDPQMKTTYEGPESGVGASYSWVGNSKVGAGKTTIEQSEPDKLVKLKLEFLEPFAATHTAEFTLQPEGDGTKVTWSMYGTSSFVEKAFQLFMDMDSMVGNDFEKGLTAMKAEAEKAPSENDRAAPAS